jgi:diguanylate cyclase (GGDEF)-like protein
MVTVISRFRVRNGLEEEVRKAFVNRPRHVEKADGFCGLAVLTDASDPSVFMLLTRWTDEPSFRRWHGSDAHRHSHEMIPAGLKLDAEFTSLTVGNSVEDPAGTHTVSDALEGQTVSLCRWLMESDSVFALLVAPDGGIRARNQASHELFPPDPARSASNIWDYLVCSDADPLRRLLSDVSAKADGRLLLNLMDKQNSPVSLEVGLLRCSGATLLLGARERRHDSRFQTEILTLSNDLALMMREAGRKNRELQEANETIEKLARIDPLTGLANRRTLDEAFHREIARAARLSERLSMLIADLDHFKSFNDEFGHVVGDQVLARAAEVFGGQLRPYDLAARYGGEEFVLLLPGTSTADAIVIAERIRKGVGELVMAECPRPITVSLGVATWLKGETPQEFLARADAGLYIAKSTGRNRVQAAAGNRA